MITRSPRHEGGGRVCLRLRSAPMPRTVRKAVRNRAGALAAAVLMGAALCGCSGVALGPDVPPAADWTTTQSASAAPTATHSASVIPKVTASKRALKATLGIQVFWNSSGSAAHQEADVDRILNYIVGLGANSVAFNFWFFTNGEYPTRVYEVPGQAPTPAEIAMAVKAAHERGLRVLIRPLLNEANISVIRNDWRGTIQPRSLTTWFASYYAFLKPYLQAAQSSKAEAFSIGTELDSLAPDKQHWTIFKKTVAQIFHGQLSYADNWTRWQGNPSYEPVSDPIAVDAYPQLPVSKDATLSELKSAWLNWLHRQPEAALRKTVLQEVGISAVAGAYTHPAFVKYPSGTPLDLSVQRNWFAASCSAAKEAHVAGIYFYAVNTTDQPSKPAITAHYASSEFINRSDSVIKTCFASGWS